MHKRKIHATHVCDMSWLNRTRSLCTQVIRYTPKLGRWGGINCVYIEQFCLYIFKKLLQSPFLDTISLGKLDQLSMGNAYTNQLHSVLSLLWFCEGGGRQNKRILCNFKLFKAPCIRKEISSQKSLNTLILSTCLDQTAKCDIRWRYDFLKCKNWKRKYTYQIPTRIRLRFQRRGPWATSPTWSTILL